jgi:recombination protein RecA
MNIIEKSGAWYSFNGERMGQGRENVKRFLVENGDFRDRIVDLIKEKSGLKKVKAEMEGKKAEKS